MSHGSNPFAPGSSASASMDTNSSSSSDGSPAASPGHAAAAAAGAGALHAVPAPAVSTAAGPSVVLAAPSFPASILQTVDICQHVLVTLDLAAGNYAQWRRFFDAVIGMFGLRSHLDADFAAPLDNPDWVMVDHCVVHWLYTTISPELLEIVMQPENTTATVWASIQGIFHDNQLSRAVYIDAEYHACVQGDLTVWSTAPA
ncbi:uncharacterized protein LOC125548195 isoform X2 [Triticum urartu]|uniref:uncharacterized protein LOC125547808 isoform X2 n=1 Tax=Triticum urartu TaxID=4572 RepID=UPI00204385DB|nr:uncharacterized protein LOC125547808 isoform X2 [Triticum urartu]XP_048567819.1 uncharacterized protein LOC125548195 isoform X2 [Triticum urartu]